MVGHNIVKIFIHLVPVHDIPPIGNVLGPPVLVLEIVCMFPYIQAKNGKVDLVANALHEGIVLINDDEYYFIQGSDFGRELFQFH
jgi:hypothetical protein